MRRRGGDDASGGGGDGGGGGDVGEEEQRKRVELWPDWQVGGESQGGARSAGAPSPEEEVGRRM